MPDPWFAVEATVRRNAKLAALPNDTARYGWVVMLGEAKLLRQSGSFSPGQWPESMGRFARYLSKYLEQRLIHRAPNYCEDTAKCLRGRGPFPDGQLVIHDWPEHQREHALRQDKYRHPTSDAHSDALGDTGSDANRDVTTDGGTRALSLSYVSSHRSPGEGSGERARLLFEELTQVPYALPPHSRNSDRVLRWVEKDGWEKVERAAREVAEDLGGYPEVNQLCNSMDNYLHPSLGAQVVSARDKAAHEEAEAERRAHQRRLDKTAAQRAWFEANAKGNSDAA